MVKEKDDLTYSDPQPMQTPAKKKTNSIWVLLVIIVIVTAFFAIKGNWGGITDVLNPPEVPPVVHNLTKANVELYKFDVLSSNKSTNVELWLLNIGETTATNITVHVRSRTVNGTVLYDNEISVSSLVLRSNESCTGDYTIPSKKQTLYHTVEVSWMDGRHTYSQVTQ